MNRRLGYWLGVGAFIFMAVWAVTAAIRLEQPYQDDWVLDGLWLPFAILLVIYLINVSFSSNLQYITILSATMTFLLNALPAMKYMFTYDCTTDTAVHISLMRTIVVTGQLDPLSSYVNTPGFHILAVLLADLSGIHVEFWAKIISAFLGSLTPLAFYMLGKRVSMPPSLAKLIIILAGLSLPVLYTLNGTSFTIPIFISLLAILFLREVDKSNGLGLSYTILLLLFVTQIVFWHPSSSLLVPIIIIFSGILSRLDYKGTLFLEQSKQLPFLGILGIISAITYWMYDANFVWKQFIKNISLALAPDITPDLIPQRLFEISLEDRLLIVLFNHARDGILLALAIVGLALLLKKINYSDPFARFMRTYGLIWLMCAMPLVGIFGAGFGAQGYKRFLFYLVGASPVLAGYGLWRGMQALRNFAPWIPEKNIVATSLLLIVATASLQLYPYQPAVPLFRKNGEAIERTPLLWFHQTNTIYQHDMIKFALDNISTDQQLITDYIGQRQIQLFFDAQNRPNLRRTVNQKAEPAFLLLHWPGKAGAYAEQAEYRSLEAIMRWRVRPGIDTIYDNGGSFILYHPQNAQEPFALEEPKK